MSRSRSLWWAAGAMAMLAAAARPAGADPVAEFYQGRQVRLVVGGEAGSEYDSWGRILARHMTRHIPGRPTFIVTNMPGGGQIIATNYLFNIADKDGSVIGMVSRNLPYLALTGAPTLRGDATKLNWIGSPERANRVCAASAKANVKSMEDLKTRELVVGGTGAGAGTTAVPVLLTRLLDLKFKLIDGYRGSPAVMLAIERGELEGVCLSIEALRGSRPEWLKSGEIRVLFNLEREKLRGFDVPSVFELTTTDRQRQILDVLNSGSDFGRPLVTPPGVPEARVAALRRALAAMTEDAEAIADAAKSGYEVGLISGEQMTGRLATLMRTPKDIVEETERMAK
jgi:tripartite-type tricarboxylate transporter receptor subunit TctC